MPNVGKSTLFNALTETQGALAANYPFATIEPNVGIVEVPDSRLPIMAVINKSVKTIPASLEFVDVAGLVKGASDGEGENIYMSLRISTYLHFLNSFLTLFAFLRPGLGNKFLANIRECDAIVHVVRCFEDENVIHVDGTVDPLRDADVINLELVLADGAQVDKRLERVRKDKNKDEHELNALEKLKVALDEGKPARSVDLEEEEELSVKR